MSQKPHEDSLQFLENKLLDADVRPKVLRRGMLGKDSGGVWRNLQLNKDGNLILPSGAATSAKQDSILTELEKKADLTEIQPVEEKGLYTTAIEYDASGNAVYVGEAVAGTLQSQALWRIKKITYDASNNATDVKWADGVTTLTKEWDERASYTYS